MGKMKTKRQKLHQKAARVKNYSGQKQEKMEMSEEVQMAKETPDDMPALFSKVDIDMNALTRQLPGDGDTKSVITSKSFRGVNIKKKDKRKLKHEFWMKKVDVLQTMKTEVRDKKKREKTVIVGDMKPLEDSLPTLDLLLRECSTANREQDKKSTSKVKGILRESQRKKNMVSDISLFQQVLEHPSYKKNPRGTITEHLRNKLKQENMNS